MSPKSSQTSSRDGLYTNLALFGVFSETEWRWIPRRFLPLRENSAGWIKRRAAWLDHANTFTAIKCDEVSLGWNDPKNGNDTEDGKKNLALKEKPSLNDSPRWRAIRLEFLSIHLDILDRKFGVLLQFQALLGIVVNILLSFKHKEEIRLGLVWLSLPSNHISIWLSLLFLIGCIWLVDTILCLTGIRRIVWGDMGKTVSEAGPDHSNPPDIKEAEKQHVDELIDEIIERTAKFRLAVVTTIVNVILLMFLALAIF